MRIIGGTYGGRILQVPKGLPVRPTTDRTKESLFNILEHRLYWEDSRVLDLFSGTGNIALECVSRGAAFVQAVDRHRKCISSIERHKKILKADLPEVLCMDVWKYVKTSKDRYNLIFIDPPYAMPKQEELLALIFERNILAEEGLLILEHSSSLSFSSLPRFSELRKYGSSHLSFFE
ncbi:MAG: 16S rRNA (guanine(966)-N(2))-methyltransferase RsmD [Bacteroidota bacterium]